MTAGFDPRAQIDAAIAAGQIGRAQSLVKHYWQAEPTLANAAFVVDRLSKSRPAPAFGYKLQILRSFTVEPLIPLVRAAAACWGLDLTVKTGEFNAYVQEILNPASGVYRDPPDVIVLAVQTRDVAPEIWSGAVSHNESQRDTAIQRVASSYRTWIETIRSRCAADIVIHNLEKPAVASAGILDAQLVGGQLDAIERINSGLVELASGLPGVHVLDYDSLVARHGRQRWFDEQKWLAVRLPIAADCLIHLVDEWVRFLMPISGRQAKCLACDLDNTLWGGVIGEDGLHGIKLGAEYPGAAYQNLQRAMADLVERGVILAVCSKNNEADAIEVLDKHPEMLLKRGDFSALRINWNDKVQNLREIAAELNIGIDSLVLIDDNPVEREFVRELLPEVTVIDVDADAPLGHAEALRRCPLFERLEVSDEDRRRNRIYAQQRERTELQSSAATVEDYYRSLEMVATFGLADEATRARIAQLTQKTNQLNMTTRRYSEQDVQNLMDDPRARVYWARVEDRFGDNGIVGVMIVRMLDDEWELDTFLLSCRVIGRTVETAMLAQVADHSRQAGVARVVGSFMATAKNAPAREIYASNGFRLVQESAGQSRWELDLSSTKLRTPPWIESRFLQAEKALQ